MGVTAITSQIRVQVSCVAIRDGNLAMIRRLDPGRATSNCIIHAGGHVELGETLEEACAREMNEETGLKVQDLKLKGVVSFISHTGSGYHSVCFFFVTDNVIGEFHHHNPDELEKVQPVWVPINGIENNIDLPSYHRAFTKFLLEEPDVMNARVEWFVHGGEPEWAILNKQPTTS